MSARRRLPYAALLFGVAAATLLVALPATAVKVTREESLPPQLYAPASGDSISDLWTFQCPAGGSARIKVDTVPVSGGATSSPLDPIFRVYLDTWPAIVASGDDEVSCTVAPVCGFSCPERLIDCLSGGEYTVLVFTSGAVSGTCGAAWGVYRIEIEVFDALAGGGLSLPAEKVKLGGQEPRRGFAWGFIPAGPAADDVHFWHTSTPDPAGSATPGFGTSVKQRSLKGKFFEGDPP